jgi:hypothetical protein
LIGDVDYRSLENEMHRRADKLTWRMAEQEKRVLALERLTEDMVNDIEKLKQKMSKRKKASGKK